MLEGLEGIADAARDLGKGASEMSEGLSASQIEYLSELDFAPEDWADLNTMNQQWQLGDLDNRMEELGVPVGERSEVAHSLLSPDMAEGYDDYIVEHYGTGGYVTYENSEFHKLEAPQDHVQIEQVSEVLANCEELRYENWTSLELGERVEVLNALEHRIAEIEQRPACPVRIAPLGEGCWGGYSPATKDITINSEYVAQNDGWTYREIIDTLVHEGRHAYQDYNVTVAETHPRHSEVVSWSECMEGGKWGYFGDCSTLLGQRLYEQQSVEIDARNFAADVLDKLNLNA